MAKNICIIILLLLLFWTSKTIIRLENYHYASAVGFCKEIDSNIERYKCLRSKETRTSSLWHLYYALFDAF